MSEVKKVPEIGKIEFYPHSYSYAANHNEVDAYRADYNVRVAAVRLFNKAVYDNYKNYVFNSETALDKMKAQIGKERTKAIVCSTVNSVTNRWDKRYTNAVYEWAAASEYDFTDLISNVHPCLINSLAERMISEP